VGRVNTASKQELSVIQQEVLIGTLLGDGRLESRSKRGSARLRIHHGDAQRGFLFWKYDIFENVVTKKPWRVAWHEPRTGSHSAAWFFHTKTLTRLRPFHQLFYSTGKKIVPPTIGRFLTPRALATWFMDDGCMTSTSAIINTQGFSVPQQAILQRWFREELGLETRLQKDRLTYRLWMNRANAEQLKDIIRPYVPHCMQYKITPRND